MLENPIMVRHHGKIGQALGFVSKTDKVFCHGVILVLSLLSKRAYDHGEDNLASCEAQRSKTAEENRELRNTISILQSEKENVQA